MSYINYKNLYTIYNDLCYNLFIDDLNEFQNLISNDNHSKSIYRNEILDISFLQFNNFHKENIIDLDSGDIYNIGSKKINIRKYKYFKIDFKRFITLSNVTLYDESYNDISYILWTKSKEKVDDNSIFDTSSQIVNDISLIHVKEAVFQIDNYKNFPNYLYYKPIKTDKIFYYPIDTDISFINYYAFNDNYEDLPKFYRNYDDNIYINNRTPSISESTNIINNIGPLLYGDELDNFFSIEDMNNYLYNNTKIEFDRAFFDMSAITQIDENYNYAIKFFYNNHSDIENNRYDTSNVYIDLSSDIFRLFNLTDISSQNIKNINIDNNMIKVLDLSANTEISFNFIYNVYKDADFSISNTINGDYQIVGTTKNVIIDKYPLSNTNDLSSTELIKYMIPIILYNNKYVLVKDNNYSKLITNDSSSSYLISNNLKNTTLSSNDISSNTITSNTINTNDIKVHNNLNIYDFQISEIINSFNVELINLNSMNINKFNGNFNLLHNVDFNVNYPYKINTDKLNINILKIFNDEFLNYNNDYLEFKKNIYSDKLVFNNVYSNKIIYNIANLDISFNKTDINNIICNKSLFINEVIKINYDFNVDMAYSDRGYMMQISSYQSGLYDSGWNIELNTSNNINCTDKSYIRLYPLQTNNNNTYGSVFEIESYYLRHSSSLNWIKNIDYSNISDTQYLSKIVYKDQNNNVFIENFNNISTKIFDTQYYPNLNIINNIKPKFFYRDSTLNKLSSGLIAQDLQENYDLSFLVYSNYHNYKLEKEKLYINYEGLQPYIVASLQELYFILEKINEWHENYLVELNNI